jgi:hypothetical protein
VRCVFEVTHKDEFTTKTRRNLQRVRIESGKKSKAARNSLSLMIVITSVARDLFLARVAEKQIPRARWRS